MGATMRKNNRKMKNREKSLVGQKIRFRPFHRECSAPLVTATIIWVHPRKRFVLVEYDAAPRPPYLFEKTPTIRECLRFDEVRAICERRKV